MLAGKFFVFLTVSLTSCLGLLAFFEAKLVQEEGLVLFNTYSVLLLLWELKKYNLPGALPPQLVKLPHLQVVDFAYNYLSGTIPREWASMQLTSITLLVNRLSGEIPKELGNITTLTYLSLEANQISGIIPPDLGKLINLQTLMLSSNRFTGNLPVSFSGLINLTDLINDNNFSGTIPIFIQNWKKLERLEMHATGLEGPIPSNIYLLNNLVEL
ncbi:hypothetical protein POTOM_039590 [Populus tomentosa]|uniref:Uncharacterized protein n=1 Tax=Populus tomentosa TaxID=118781 RepID=A0A8X7YU33_POPTO|nr:hypothetical protein POTOM_039590 [Populus tomentosa]